ncbi:MAG: hypothetical protein HY363_00720 [Candidatus Aenigmarchaeota archaeon]|nr:hypothetical protein [Candidatus Aenigmarchaeota archaeon]
MTLKKLIIGITAVFSLTGCSIFTKSYDQDRNYSGPQSLPAEIAQRFDYRNNNETETRLADTILLERQNSLYFTHETRSFDAYDCFLDRANTISFDYYQTKLAEHPPLVIVLPILGGDYTIERAMCEVLANNGISSALVHRQNRMLDVRTYPSLETMILSVTAERRRTLDVIASSGEVDTERMGSFGISMGAITAVPLIAVEHRLKYNILGLAGGDIPAIIMDSSEDSVEKFVNDAMNFYGVDRRQLLERLRRDFNSDPANLAPYVDARNVHVFLACFDWVVPTQYGLLLREKLGRPELDMLPTGHYTSFLFYFWIKSLAVDFFQEKFGVDVEAVERAKIRIVRQAQLRRRRT